LEASERSMPLSDISNPLAHGLGSILQPAHISVPLHTSLHLHMDKKCGMAVRRRQKSGKGFLSRRCLSGGTSSPQEYEPTGVCPS
jgi:hypothetical protein